MSQVQARLTAGWVALVQGDTERAVRHASEAAADAGRRRDRAALAESLELRALAGPAAGRTPGGSPRQRRSGASWATPPGRRARRWSARSSPATTRPPGAPRRALAEVGARGYRAALALVHPLTGVPPVVVQSLGRFRVVLSGEPVPLGAWQSRKARDLLKLLVARRGRPTPRDVLMEALWPEQGPGPLGNRLSVLLSTVRAVLDPGKHHDQDHFVGADKNAVWLDRANLSIDVEEFLEAAEDALVLHRAGDGSRSPGSRPPRPPTPVTFSRRTPTRTGLSPCARRLARRTRPSRGRSRMPLPRAATWMRPRATRYGSSSATRTTSPPISGWSRYSTPRVDTAKRDAGSAPTAHGWTRSA